MTKMISETEMVIAEDNLIADVQFAIHNLIELKKISRAELARRIGVSEARISQIFEDEPQNLTLRTIAQIFHAVGEEARVTSAALDRVIPGPTPKQDTQAATSVTRIEATSLRLRVEERSRVVFQQVCNDNSPIHEFDLVA